MEEQDKLALIRSFLNREDLTGTNLKLKEKVQAVDADLTRAKHESQKLLEDLKQTQQAANNKSIEVMGLTERLESLCELVLDAEDALRGPESEPENNEVSEE